MKIIGIDIENSETKILKNLKVGWYPFGNYEKPCEENKYQWKKNGVDYDLINEIYQIDEKLPEISLCCIVGKNGSGKSTLLEIMYRIINNFAYKLTCQMIGKDFMELSYALGLNATLYYEREKKLGCIIIKNEVVKFSTDLIEKHKAEIIDRYALNRATEILANFFYTISTNYSIYSFNQDDYKPDFNNEDENVNDNWLCGIFNKVDGYLSPISIIPFRNENGVIDNASEKRRAIKRLSTLSILYYIQNKKFINDYIPYSLTYKLNIGDNYPKDLAKRLESYFELASVEYDNKFTINLINSIAEIWKEKLTYDLLNCYSKVEKPLLNAITYYLAYKTIKISLTYKDFQEKNDFDLLYKKFYNRNIGDHDYGDIFDELIEKLKDPNEKSHISFKINQCIEFLKRNYYKYNKEKEETIDIKDFIKDNIRKDDENHYYNYDDISLMMPPPIFDYELKYCLKEKNGIRLKDFSSGEKQLLYSFSYIAYHIYNIQSIKKDEYRVPYHHINLIFDEAELYYHPEMQRLFISELLDMLKWCHIDKKIIKSISIIIVTHSPFILSDISNNNLLCLEDGKAKTFEGKTLGANIHEILFNQFFIKYPLGEVARIRINEILTIYQNIKRKNLKEKERKKFLKQEKMYDYFVELIGEPYMKDTLTQIMKEIKHETN